MPSGPATPRPLRQLRAWLDDRPLDDANLAAYVGHLQRLRAAICDADLGDALIRPGVEVAVAARADDGVTVTGRLRFEVEA